MAPYAMAHLKLGMQLAAADLPKADQATWAYDFKSNERLGIYLHIIANLVEMLSLMREIDQAINEHGGWPIQ